MRFSMSDGADQRGLRIKSQPDPPSDPRTKLRYRHARASRDNQRCAQGLASAKGQGVTRGCASCPTVFNIRTALISGSLLDACRPGAP